MSTKLIVVGAVSTLCLSAGLAGAEPPAVPGTRQPPGPMVSRHGGPSWQGPFGRRAEAGKRQVEWMAQVLRLSAEQRAAFEDVVDQQVSERAALRERLREGGKKLAEALDGATPAPVTVGSLMIEQRDLMRDLDAARDQTDEALRALLTAEQQATFDSLPKPRPHPRMGRGGGPMGVHGMAPMPPPPCPPDPEPPEGELP